MRRNRGRGMERDELVRLGLPFSFIRPLLDARPGDDLAWIRGLAASSARSARPARRDVALVGALAGQLAKPLRLEALHRPDRGPNGQHLLLDPGRRGFPPLFERVRRDRWTHLVVGPLDAKPSWTAPEGRLVGRRRRPAGRPAPRHRARRPAGLLQTDDAGRALRATPIEVALALRALVAREGDPFAGRRHARLLALIPTALMLIAGNVTLQVAAVRAGITLGTVMFLAPRRHMGRRLDRRLRPGCSPRSACQRGGRQRRHHTQQGAGNAGNKEVTR